MKNLIKCVAHKRKGHHKLEKDRKKVEKKVKGEL